MRRGGNWRRRSGARRLSDKIKPLSMPGESLSGNLSDIRELIEQARRQAASIKVAVQADGDCIRLYRPQIQSSNFNTLTLTVKTKSPNDLLFYMGGETTMEFLAVEMHDGKVSLLRDVGSGSTRLEYPGLDIGNNRWTGFNATRLGSRGFLSVHQLEATPSQTVTAASPGPARVLHVDDGTAIHLGGVADGTRRPAALQRSTFRGCLGKASLNEKNIGLRNYISRQGRCGGCFSSPQVEETSFHFDGSGFSLVHNSLRATSTSVILLFKTLSPGGLLMYLASNNTRDFLSVELIEGCLRLTFDLGSGPARQQVASRSYVGCIKNVEIARLNFDLLRDAYGVRKGCVLEAVRSVSMLSGGFVQIAPRSLSQEAEFLFPFKSISQSGVLLAAFTDDRAQRRRFLPAAAHFGSSRHSHMTFTVDPVSVHKRLSVRLSLRTRAWDGLLLLLADAVRMDFAVLRLAARRALMSADLGKGVATAASAVSVNDGKWHTVTADVGRRAVSLSVDACAADAVAVKGNRLDVDGRLYLGGLPRARDTQRINVTTSLGGCVRSVSVNGLALDLSRPASQYDITSCFAKEETGSYFNSSGYAALMRDGYKVGSDASVSLDFQTSQPEGVLLSISSAKVDAVGLEMIKGQVVFNVNNGAGRVRVASGGPVLCEGRWHRLLARKTKHTLSLSVRQQPLPAIHPCRDQQPRLRGWLPGRNQTELPVDQAGLQRLSEERSSDQVARH